MKKYFPFNKLLLFYIIFFAATGAVLLILFTDIDTPFSFGIVIGYMIVLLVIFCYFLIKVIVNLRKSASLDIKKRVYTFLLVFAGLSGLQFLMDYGFNQAQVNVYRLAIPFGLALGIAFFDLAFVRKK
ncbi:hypothetical protein SAMN05421736_12486 [Evansella caseinilytica]|uniref:Uncharacterized protein n=1 Tax=Evansella caseinilytica TaxID=1503961 RepID=A0A1H3UQK8_9BACI|nr:hypothetical protein [Evansella caseinilytica]SDZ64760.1 hypothetical protein SAMN05421736_12486 [Evansella caseinilytica]